MRRFFSLPRREIVFDEPAVTIGMFDGVHLGHAAVLELTAYEARRRNREATVVTFDAHPRSVLSPDGAPPMVTSLEHRLTLFEQAGVDTTVVLPFTKALAETPARSFVAEILLGRLDASCVVLGPDSHFGADREGTEAFMRRMGERRGFSVVAADPVCLDDRPVSSTSIRDAVQSGDLDGAAAMLGRPVSVLGTVEPGEGVGRELGFPTLNLDPHHELHPPSGVYLSTTRAGDSLWPSVTNVGHRPTVAAESEEDILIESHVLVEIGRLYHQHVEVTFLRKLREERRFPDHDALRAQIALDVETARDLHTA